MDNLLIYPQDIFRELHDAYKSELVIENEEHQPEKYQSVYQYVFSNIALKPGDKTIIRNLKRSEDAYSVWQKGLEQIRIDIYKNAIERFFTELITTNTAFRKYFLFDIPHTKFVYVSEDQLLGLKGDGEKLVGQDLLGRVLTQLKQVYREPYYKQNQQEIENTYFANVEKIVKSYNKLRELYVKGKSIEEYEGKSYEQIFDMLSRQYDYTVDYTYKDLFMNLQDYKLHEENIVNICMFNVYEIPYLVRLFGARYRYESQIRQHKYEILDAWLKEKYTEFVNRLDPDIDTIVTTVKNQLGEQHLDEFADRLYAMWSSDPLSLNISTPYQRVEMDIVEKRDYQQFDNLYLAVSNLKSMKSSGATFPNIPDPYIIRDDTKENPFLPSYRHKQTVIVAEKPRTVQGVEIDSMRFDTLLDYIFYKLYLDIIGEDVKSAYSHINNNSIEFIIADYLRTESVKFTNSISALLDKAYKVKYAEGSEMLQILISTKYFSRLLIVSDQLSGVQRVGKDIVGNDFSGAKLLQIRQRYVEIPGISDIYSGNQFTVPSIERIVKNFSDDFPDMVAIFSRVIQDKKNVSKFLINTFYSRCLNQQSGKNGNIWADIHKQMYSRLNIQSEFIRVKLAKVLTDTVFGDVYSSKIAENRFNPRFIEKSISSKLESTFQQAKSMCSNRSDVEGMIKRFYTHLQKRVPDDQLLEKTLSMLVPYKFRNAYPDLTLDKYLDMLEATRLQHDSESFNLDTNLYAMLLSRLAFFII